MNPFIYSALAVLCVCSIATRSFRGGGGGDSSADFLNAIPLVSIWTIAACMLSSIGLASRTRAGMASAGLVLGACAIACVACVIFLMISSERRSQERRAKRVATGSTRPTEDE